MGGSAPKAPAAPKPQDYIPLIEEQAKQNRVNTSTPYGGTNFTQNPDGTWTSNTSFSPQLQNMFTRQIEVAGSPDAYRDYQDQYFANARRMLDPYYEQQGQQFEQQMANRGLPVGGEAYDDAYANRMDAQNRAYESAAFNALQSGQQARQVDYNMMAGLLGNAQAAPIAPIDTMGAYNTIEQGNMGRYQGELSNWQNRQNNIWGTAGSLGSAATTAFMFSDRRLKKNIKKIGTRADGLNIYRFDYVWDEPSIGFMADEVEAIYPDAVFEIHGFKAVDYSRI